MIAYQPWRISDIKENIVNRKRVADTDIGQKLIGEVEDLKQLLFAYREGELKEKI